MGMQAPGNRTLAQGATAPAQPGQPAQAPQPGAAQGTQAQDDQQPDIMRRHGWGYPRWPILAALFLTPFIVIGYLGDLFYVNRVCNLGTFCTLDTLPAAIQVFLIWLGFGLLWLASLIFGGPHLEGGSGRQRGPLASFLRALSNFEPVRWHLIGAGGLVLLLIIFATMLGRLSAAGFAMGMIVVFVALCTLFWRQPEQTAAPQQTPQGQMRQVARGAANPLYILRNLAPFRYIVPNRVAPPAQGQAPAQPPAQGQGQGGPPPPPPTLGGNQGNQGNPVP